MTLPNLESDLVLAEQAGGVLEVTLNRPDKLNALTSAMYRDLMALLAFAEHDEATRVVFLAANGGSFTAGNDLKDFFNAKPGEVGEAVPFIKAMHAFPKVIVAAVQGNAVGVGMTMLLHVDLVVAADDAKLITPFVDLGATPEAGSAKLLPAWLGYQRAARMLLLGEPLPAKEAHDCGLVAKVVPAAELSQAAGNWAQALAEKPPLALRESKRLMRQAINKPLDEVIEEDLTLFAEMLQGDEARAVLAARMQKGKK